MKVFVPFSEDLIARHGLSLGDLVPFDLQYECLRMREIDSEAGAGQSVQAPPRFGSEPFNRQEIEAVAFEPAGLEA